MDTHFLQQLFLSKLEEARFYSGLLSDQLTSEQNPPSVHVTKELENWLTKLEYWQTQTAALRALTDRLNFSENDAKTVQQTSKSSIKKSAAGLPKVLFEGIEIEREVVNKNGPMLSAGYHPAKQVLEVEFKPGSLYRYYDVPEELYQEMLENPRQAMSFFTRHIRNNYEFKQINLS